MLPLRRNKESPNGVKETKMDLSAVGLDIRAFDKDGKPVRYSGADVATRYEIFQINSGSTVLSFGEHGAIRYNAKDEIHPEHKKNAPVTGEFTTPTSSNPVSTPLVNQVTPK